MSKEVLNQMTEYQTKNMQVNSTHMSHFEMPRFTKSFACGLLINYWDTMPKYQVLNGWQIAIYGKETTEDA